MFAYTGFIPLVTQLVNTGTESPFKTVASAPPSIVNYTYVFPSGYLPSAMIINPMPTISTNGTGYIFGAGGVLTSGRVSMLISDMRIVGAYPGANFAATIVTASPVVTTETPYIAFNYFESANSSNMDFIPEIAGNNTAAAYYKSTMTLDSNGVIQLPKNGLFLDWKNNTFANTGTITPWSFGITGYNFSVLYPPGLLAGFQYWPGILVAFSSPIALVPT